jgi:hypothetical protein
MFEAFGVSSEDERRSFNLRIGTRKICTRPVAVVRKMSFASRPFVTGKSLLEFRIP